MCILKVRFFQNWEKMHIFMSMNNEMYDFVLELYWIFSYGIIFVFVFLFESCYYALCTRVHLSLSKFGMSKLEEESAKLGRCFSPKKSAFFQISMHL